MSSLAPDVGCGLWAAAGGSGHLVGPLAQVVMPRMHRRLVRRLKKVVLVRAPRDREVNLLHTVTYRYASRDREVKLDDIATS